MMNRVFRLALILCALLVPLLAFGQDVVKWKASIPADAKPGSNVTVTLTAKIDKGWHLYSINAVEDGPTPTSITASDPLKLSGKLDESKPLKKYDPNFKKEVEFYEDEATFTVPVTLGPDPTKESVQVLYQTCNDKKCNIPKTVDVPLSGEDAKPIVIVGEVDQAKQKGLLSFMVLAFTAGLLALTTPCVFPMIPITVSFFSKRKEGAGPRDGLKQAGAYCFGIIGAFTAVGLLISVLFGASGVQTFATNPFVNIILAAVFVLLALSLFGIFELQLPASVTNAFSPHKRTGLLAPLLMGLTFTLTSFTCTVPFVGTILVSAAKGDLLYPLVGMLAFSTAFALPFFLLALFPQYLAKLPKSGSWLEMMKGFMGFLEIAAAIKFISNADLVWGTGLISRSAFLVIWAVILICSALYLLRVIKLPKADVPEKIGPGRMVVVALTLATVVWLSLGAAGRSLGFAEAFLPPGKADGWIEDYPKAIQIARRDHKLLLIDFTGVTCTNCRLMERTVFPEPEVAKEFGNFVLTRLYTDRPQDKPNQALLLKLTNEVSMPTYVILSPDEKVLGRLEGATDVQSYLTFLRAPKRVALNH